MNINQRFGAIEIPETRPIQIRDPGDTAHRGGSGRPCSGPIRDPVLARFGAIEIPETRPIQSRDPGDTAHPVLARFKSEIPETRPSRVKITAARRAPLWTHSVDPFFTTIRTL